MHLHRLPSVALLLSLLAPLAQAQSLSEDHYARSTSKTGNQPYVTVEQTAVSGSVSASTAYAAGSTVAIKTQYGELQGKAHAIANTGGAPEALGDVQARLTQSFTDTYTVHANGLADGEWVEVFARVDLTLSVISPDVPLSAAVASAYWYDTTAGESAFRVGVTDARGGDHLEGGSYLGALSGQSSFWAQVGSSFSLSGFNDVSTSARHTPDGMPSDSQADASSRFYLWTVDGAYLTSASGTNYALAPVPEPTSLWLMLAGGAWIGVLGLRRTRRTGGQQPA